MQAPSMSFTYIDMKNTTHFERVNELGTSGGGDRNYCISVVRESSQNGCVREATESIC